MQSECTANRQSAWRPRTRQYPYQTSIIASMLRWLCVDHVLRVVVAVAVAVAVEIDGGLVCAGPNEETTEWTRRVTAHTDPRHAPHSYVRNVDNSSPSHHPAIRTPVPCTCAHALDYLHAVGLVRRTTDVCNIQSDAVSITHVEGKLCSRVCRINRSQSNYVLCAYGFPLSV